MVRQSNSPDKNYFLGTRAKLPARNLSLRRRGMPSQCLSSNDQVILENSKKMLIFFLVYDHLFPSDMIHWIRDICIVRYLGLKFTYDVKFERQKKIRRTIESFDNNCRENFRFNATKLNIT